jgi:hypothetical protein
MARFKLAHCGLCLVVSLGCGSDHAASAKPEPAGASGRSAGASGRDGGAVGLAADGGEADAGSAADAAAGGGGAPDVDASVGTPAANGGGGGTGANQSAAGSGGSASDPSAALFDQDSLIRVDITLPSAAISSLGAAPSTYVAATVKVGATTLQQVGVRIKGEASLRTLDQKAAFKLKFDEFVNGQKLLGLTRLTLNNMVSDPSFIAERLSYHVYALANVPAPRCNHMLVYVNDEFYGVYANVESEDKTFLRRFFSDDSGNLYEDGQVDLAPGNEGYFDLETNETANDRTDLKNLIDVIDKAGTDSYLSDLDAALDTQHFLRFSALEALVDQWDEYSYTFFENNNFRLYHDPTTGKFTFLPWGMDLSLKPFAYSTRAHIPLLSVPKYLDDPTERDAGGLIFKRCLQSTTCKAAYIPVVKQLLGVFEGADLEALAAHHYAQIKDYVYSETRKEFSNDQFEAGYQSLLTTIRTRGAAVRSDLGM